MMLFLHLFNQTNQVALCYTSINFWNGKPIVYALSRIGGFCVPIYLFLSGYGLSFVFDKQQGKMQVGKRLRKLMLNYWVVMAVFIPLGAYLVPESYPGDLKTLVLNLITWEHTYNAEWWFLFPYLCLLLLSPVYLKVIFKQQQSQCLKFIGLLTLLYFGVYAAHKSFRTAFDTYYVLEQSKQFIYCLYSFSLGAIFYKQKFIERSKAFFAEMSAMRRKVCLMGGITLICLLRMMLGPSIINPFFAVVFIVLFCNLHLPAFLQKILCYMSGHSTNMWLVHTFFAYYYFHDFIYGLHYPLFIYAVLIVLSLISSYVIRFLLQIFRLK